MAEARDVVVNPLLRLRTSAVREGIRGGPKDVSKITPQLYAWKGAKWISKIEFRVDDRKGFWEERGYSNSAHPWREDRYS